MRNRRFGDPGSDLTAAQDVISDVSGFSAAIEADADHDTEKYQEQQDFKKHDFFLQIIKMNNGYVILQNRILSHLNA